MPAILTSEFVGTLRMSEMTPRVAPATLGIFRLALAYMETNILQISLPEEIEQVTSHFNLNFNTESTLYSKTQCLTGNFRASSSLYKLETNIIQISLP